MKAAVFPYEKTLEEFDFKQLNPAVSPLFLNELATCKFVQAKQNLVLIGNPGRGKTHLSIALGLKACQAVFHVLFKNAASLSTELCEARDSYTLRRLERTLAKADLLVLDELSYLSFNRNHSELLFKVLSDRSERKSTIVTTNLLISRWTEHFEQTTLITALVDRLTFHSHVLDMNRESYRLMATKSKNGRLLSGSGTGGNKGGIRQKKAPGQALHTFSMSPRTDSRPLSWAGTHNFDCP